MKELMVRLRSPLTMSQSGRLMVRLRSPLTMSQSEGLTSFQKKVYTVVSQIPRGQVRSYRWVALKAKRPKAVRAVGRALNKNPFSIIVPCHRVVHQDGSLGKYAFGRDLKKRLLEIEATCYQR